MSKSALGRGLGALLGGSASSSRPVGAPLRGDAAAATPVTLPAGDRVRQVAVERIRPCPFQPRKDFAEETLSELAASIRERGIVQPLIVRPKADHFELIAGERRWRAAQLAGLRELPVIVREADDAAVLELALIENLQRENLNPIEEAQGYSQLIEQFRLRQEDVATKVGRSRVVVANALRLLKLPAELQDHLRHGRLSVGHAKVLLGLEGAARQRAAAQRILAGGLSVRQTEELVSRWQAESAGPKPDPAPGTAQKATAPDVHSAALQNRLQERFGLKVSLRYRQGKGSVEVRFSSDDELDRLLQTVGVSLD